MVAQKMLEMLTPPLKASVIVLFAMSAWADGPFYVDAENGNDANDGLAPGVGRARKTLVGVDELTAQNRGDVVYLAEGTYADEVYTDADYGRVRGRVKAGVKLIATGARDKTIIKGEIDKDQTDTNQKGCGPNAVSCLCMETDALVQGVTLTDGHVADITSDGKKTNGGAVRGAGGYLIDCVITGNYGNRGGALSGSFRAIGCRFYDNWSQNTGSDMYGGSAYNCFFGGVLRSNYNVYTGGPFVNCTFTGSGMFGRGYNTPSFINCIIAKADGGANKNAFSTCAFVGIALSADSTADASNFSTTAADMLLDADGVPQWGSVATDRGSNDLYDAKFPTAAAVSVFKGLDGRQKARLIGGTIDLGAAEVDWRELPATSGVDLTIVGQTVSAKRNYNSELCCLGFTFDGEKVMFPDDDDTYVWSKTVEDDLANHSLVLIYSKDWYVDAVNGNDANDGFTAKRAKKTLAGAMAIPALKAGHVVHAAPGVYNEGVMAPQDTSCHCSNRVVLAKGVGLVADQGPDVTTIEGHKSKANANGVGPDAIRCVYGKDNTAYVRGFTLRNGSTPAVAYAHDTSAGGGAVAGATAVDCVITNNTCGYRGGSACAGRFIRCRIGGNACADGSTGPDGYNCTFYGCEVSGGVCLGNYYNCTLHVVPWGSGKLKIYNSLITSLSALAASSSQFYDLQNVISRGGFSWAEGSTTNEFCRFNATADETTFDAATRRPAADSILVNAGDDELFLANFPAEFSFLREQDLMGGPRRVGGAVDVGAGEYDWRTLTSADGLAWSVADAPDGQVTLSVSRTFEGSRLCTGFTYGGETVMFDDHEKGYVWTKTMPSDELLASMLTPLYSDKGLKDFYVDAVNGDDANRGIHPYCARRTLAGAMAIPELANGCVVHAAPGVYDEGAMWGGSVSNRVEIGPGIGLVADQGPAVTIIKGAAATGPDASAAGHGLDALRCAHLGYGAWLRGFTLTNGHTRNYVKETYEECACGGAVACGTGGVVVDCDITGNFCAGRGPAVYSGIYIRCRIHGNTGNYPVYQVAWLIDSAVYGGDYVYSDGTILNCSLLTGSTWGTKLQPIYNSYVAGDNGNKAYTNCVLGNAYSAMKASSTTNLTCRFGLAANVDDVLRPKAGSPLIDTADRAIYDAVIAQLSPNIALKLAQEPLDVSGGQRIYNAALDIGAGEYDWRGDFEKELRMRGVEVEEASANVTANAEEGLDLADGDTLKFKGVSLKVSGTVSFKVTVTGGGTVTAKLGETALVPDGSGVYSFQTEAGETDVVTVSFAGTGTATVSDVVLPLRGSVLIVR